MRRFAQIAITALVTWFVVQRAGLSLEEIRTFDVTSWQIRWGWIAASCALLAAGYATTGWLWSLITRDLGGPLLPPAEAIRLFMIANLGRYIPGKVWQIAGLAALARQKGVPGTTAAAAAVLGQGLALAAATVLGLGGIWSLADGAAWRWLVPGGLTVAVVIGLSPPVFRAVSSLWFRVTRTEPPESLESRQAAGWLAIAFANWVMFAVAFWLFVGGLGYDPPIVATATGFAAAYVVGYVFILAPAGIGIRESMLVVFLAPHFGAVAAGAIAAAARLWTTLIEVIPAAVFWGRHVTSAGGTGDIDG